MRRFPRAILAAAALVLFLGAALAKPSSAAALTDISRHWARAQVEAGVAAGYVSGYPDGTFRPNAPITRAEFFKLLAVAMRVPPAGVRTGLGEESLPDGQLHWSFAQGYVPAAVAAGLVVPSDYEGQFLPDTPIRRREILTAAVRALGQEPIVYQGDRSLSTPDAASYPKWLQSYAALALHDKVLTGYEDGSLGLERTATRAEALVIVQRILSRVTMNVAPTDGPAGDGVARHPGEAEPLWSWTAASGHPTVLADSDAYTFPFEVTDLALLPAAGKAAWVRYDTTDSGVLARISQGVLTEVARYPGRRPDLLAVGDDGVLWYSDGDAQLLKAGPDGQVSPVAEVSAGVPLTDRIQFGEIDWNGDFWGMGAAKVYRISTSGEVAVYDPQLAAGATPLAFAVSEDGAAWVLTRGSAEGNRLEAVSVQEGGTPQRVVLLGPSYGGLDSQVDVTALDHAGPFLWLVTQLAGRPHGLYRFDLNSGELVPQVLPRALDAGVTAQSAPGGGVLLHGDGGRYWRILP